MLRRAAALAVAVVAVSACAPTYDVTVNWTIDGDDAAGTCANLPAGTVVRVLADSRDDNDKRNEAGTRTETDLTCDKGTGSVALGAFADVRAILVSGEDELGSSSLVPVVAGGTDGYIADEAVDLDIDLAKGTLRATLTVNGASCGDADAANFTVSLFENTEPLTLVAVEEDVTVACKDGVATYTFSPATLGATYIVRATTSAGGVDYATVSDGEGVSAAGVVTNFNVDLAPVDN